MIENMDVERIQDDELRAEVREKIKKHPPGSVPMSLLCTVCDRDRREKVLDVLEKQHAFFNLMSLGKGTANSRILGYLGLGETEKAIFFAIMPTERAAEMQRGLDEKMDFKVPGHGISFLSNIHEGCYHRPVHIVQTGGNVVESKTSHDLILVVVNRGYTEEVMDSARSAGATGGTVLHARGCGLEGAEKFFGVTIQPEKEMLMIVAGEAETCAIMSAISESNGPESNAGAVSFSIPVHHVMGIGSDVPEGLL